MLKKTSPLYSHDFRRRLKGPHVYFEYKVTKKNRFCQISLNERLQKILLYNINNEMIQISQVKYKV